MTLAGLLGMLTLVVGIPLNMLVTARLWHLSLGNPNIHVLRERAIVATAVLILAVVFGVIFWSNDRPVPPLALEETKIVTRAVLLGVAVIPALYWIRIYRRRLPPPDADPLVESTDRIVAAIAALPGQDGTPQDVVIVPSEPIPVKVVDVEKPK